MKRSSLPVSMHRGEREKALGLGWDGNMQFINDLPPKQQAAQHVAKVAQHAQQMAIQQQAMMLRSAETPSGPLKSERSLRSEKVHTARSHMNTARSHVSNATSRASHLRRSRSPCLSSCMRPTPYSDSDGSTSHVVEAPMMPPAQLGVHHFVIDESPRV